MHTVVHHIVIEICFINRLVEIPLLRTLMKAIIDLVMVLKPELNPLNTCLDFVNYVYHDLNTSLIWLPML